MLEISNHTKTFTIFLYSVKQMATRFFDFDYVQQWAQYSTLAVVASRQNLNQRCQQQRQFCTTDS